MLMHVFRPWVCVLGCTSLSIHGSTHSLCSPISLCNIYCPDLETHDELTITKLWQEPFTLEIWVRTSPYNGNCCNGVVTWCSVMLNCLVGHTGNRDRHQWVFYPMHYVWDPLKEILSQWKLMTGQLGQHLTSVRKSSELHIACVCAGCVRNANYQW